MGWGINGCASVIAAILATVLAIHISFAAVVMVAVILYRGFRRRPAGYSDVKAAGFPR